MSQEIQENVAHNPVIVTEDWHGKRIDSFVKTTFDVSWNRARDWIARGKIYKNDEIVGDTGLAVATGDTIALRLHAPKLDPQQTLRREHVVYVDRHLVVVRKPSGLLTVPFEESDRDTLERQVRILLEKNKEWSTGSRRESVFVVHRLDKGTSGLLLFARTIYAQATLSEQFRDHSILRRYLAIAHGKVKSGEYRSHLVKDRGDGIRGSSEAALSRHIRSHGGGKLAITHVEVLEELRQASLIACQLETGRTNQIRIHLSEAGHPIVGETVYMRGYAGPEIPASRLMLHAAELGFLHPKTGDMMTFEDPWPEEFTSLLQRLRLHPTTPPVDAAP